jgi:hypothetical protein
MDGSSSVDLEGSDPEDGATKISGASTVSMLSMLSIAPS